MNVTKSKNSSSLDRANRDAYFRSTKAPGAIELVAGQSALLRGLTQPQTST